MRERRGGGQAYPATAAGGTVSRGRRGPRAGLEHARRAGLLSPWPSGGQDGRSSGAPLARMGRTARPHFMGRSIARDDRGRMSVSLARDAIGAARALVEHCGNPRDGQRLDDSGAVARRRARDGPQSVTSQTTGFPRGRRPSNVPLWQQLKYFLLNGPRGWDNPTSGGGFPPMSSSSSRRRDGSWSTGPVARGSGLSACPR